jgi:hypothetical protein
MSKALYGFRGGPDPRLEAELAMLRARVRQLEAELADLRSDPAVVLADEDLDVLLVVQDPALV